MSDRYPRYGPQWQHSSTKLWDVVNKHLPRLLEIDLHKLQPLLQGRSLLETAEADFVWDHAKPRTERVKQLLKFVCLKRGGPYRNGLYGLEVFIECLRASDSLLHHSLAQDLSKDLSGKYIGSYTPCLFVHIWTKRDKPEQLS